MDDCQLLLSPLDRLEANIDEQLATHGTGANTSLSIHANFIRLICSMWTK